MSSADLVERLRASATQARAIDRSALLHEAADEIERLRGRPASGDIVTRLRQTRANMIGTDDEAHYWDCHDAAAEIERLRTSNNNFSPIVPSRDTAVGVASPPGSSAALITRSAERQSPAHECGGGEPLDAGAATSHHAAGGRGHLFLTDEEREAIRFAAVFYSQGGRAADAATLRDLLERLA